MSELYKNIEFLCKDKDLTITDMCREAGVSRGALTDLKKGRTQSLSSKTLQKIAEFLDTTPDYLLGWTDDPVDYEKSEENLNAPSDVIAHFNGDAEKIYAFQKAAEQDHYDEQRETEQIELIARHLRDVPSEDRERLLKNFEETIDIYLDAKGIKKKIN